MYRPNLLIIEETGECVWGIYGKYLYFSFNFSVNLQLLQKVILQPFPPISGFPSLLKLLTLGPKASITFKISLSFTPHLIFCSLCVTFSIFTFLFQLPVCKLLAFVLPTPSLSYMWPSDCSSWNVALIISLPWPKTFVCTPLPPQFLCHLHQVACAPWRFVRSNVPWNQKWPLLAHSLSLCWHLF